MKDNISQWQKYKSNVVDSVAQGLGRNHQGRTFTGTWEQLWPDVLPVDTSDSHWYQCELNTGTNDSRRYQWALNPGTNDSRVYQCELNLDSQGTSPSP